MRRYRIDEVDFFAVYDPQSDKIYAVPSTAMAVEGCLRIDPVLNGQQKLIRWAADYTWEKHVAELQLNRHPRFQMSESDVSPHYQRSGVISHAWSGDAVGVYRKAARRIIHRRYSGRIHTRRGHPSIAGNLSGV
jgi:hypothetical protein